MKNGIVKTMEMKTTAEEEKKKKFYKRKKSAEKCIRGK
jgi:hypothetical protein